MDEYLFIELAKLQADRRRLERERRDELRRLESSEPRSNPDRAPPWRQWFANTWSKQS